MYDNQIIIDYALNLFQGKLIPSQVVKKLKPVSVVDVPVSIYQLAERLNTTVINLFIIAALDPNTLERCLDLSYSFEGIKSILAAQAVQDYRSMLSSTGPVSGMLRFSPQSVRSLLRRLGVVDPLRAYYRYMVTK